MNDFAHGLAAGLALTLLLACLLAAALAAWLSWRCHRSTRRALALLAEAGEECHDAQMRAANQLGEMIVALGRQAARARQGEGGGDEL